MTEIRIRDTKKALGEELAYLLSPIITNKKGVIVDGEHRFKDDPSWTKIKLELNDFDTYRARLIVNSARRIVGSNDYNRFAEHLQEIEPGTKPWLVASGQTIAERISGCTGIPYDLVLENLGEKYKKSTGPIGVSPLGQGEQVRVPSSLAPVVRELVTGLKNATKDNPNLTRQIIRTAKVTLRQETKRLDEANKLPPELRTNVERGKLPLEVAQLIEKRVPKQFLAADTNHIIQNKLTTVEKADSYITIQGPSYTAHGPRTTEQTRKHSSKIEFMSLGKPTTIKGKRGPNFNLEEPELTTASGKRLDVFKEIQRALEKLSVEDEAEITVRIWVAQCAVSSQ